MSHPFHLKFSVKINGYHSNLKMSFCITWLIWWLHHAYFNKRAREKMCFHAFDKCFSLRSDTKKYKARVPDRPQGVNVYCLFSKMSQYNDVINFIYFFHVWVNALIVNPCTKFRCERPTNNEDNRPPSKSIVKTALDPSLGIP